MCVFVCIANAVPYFVRARKNEHSVELDIETRLPLVQEEAAEAREKRENRLEKEAVFKDVNKMVEVWPTLQHCRRYKRGVYVLQGHEAVEVRGRPLHHTPFALILLFL